MGKNEKGGFEREKIEAEQDSDADTDTVALKVWIFIFIFWKGGLGQVTSHLGAYAVPHVGPTAVDNVICLVLGLRPNSTHPNNSLSLWTHTHPERTLLKLAQFTFHDHSTL